MVEKYSSITTFYDIHAARVELYMKEKKEEKNWKQILILMLSQWREKIGKLLWFHEITF